MLISNTIISAYNRIDMAGFMPVELMSAKAPVEGTVVGRIDIQARGGLTVSIDRLVDRAALKLVLDVVGDVGH
jgi:transposase